MAQPGNALAPAAPAAPLSLPAEELRPLVARVLEAAGADREAAEAVARSLVLANLRGVDSHGFMRVPEYLGFIADGRIDPAARPVVERNGAVVQVQGNRCFGQLAAHDGTLAAADAAAEHGVALAVVSGVKHVGRVGEYPELCAERGLVAIVFCNGGPRGGLVAPFGGRGRALGTNPLAYAFPVAGRSPVVADFSTSTVAEGKVRIHAQAGTPLPPGWIVDAAGEPATDPAALYAGGALLAAAGHKGYALGLLAEVLGGVLAGEGSAATGADPGNGFVLLAFDPGQAFPSGAAGVVNAVEAHAPAAGFERVVAPGVPELDAEQRRLAGGIPFSPETWRLFAESAGALGVDVPDLTSTGQRRA
jgi:LDH2 family malate/lactate/ureidoglycolate dehydrogenase